MYGFTRTKALLGVIAIAAAARLVDVALVSAGVATAAGSVVFAGAMLLRRDHAPGVNGLEYLAIFARPRGAPKPPEDEPPARDLDLGGAAIDPAPVGSIGAATPRGPAGFSLVAAEFGFAWVREGDHVLAVRPGDVVPGLGRVSSILRREGRWILVGDAGATLLSSHQPALASDARGPFTREMIFGRGR